MCCILEISTLANTHKNHLERMTSLESHTPATVPTAFITRATVDIYWIS